MQTFLTFLAAILLPFFLSFVWYMFFGKQLEKLNPRAYGKNESPQAKTVVVELSRNIVLAGAIFCLLSFVNIETISTSLILALVMWLGFPVVLLSGSVFHEKVPLKLAAIHAGDWLIKIVLMAILLSL